MTAPRNLDWLSEWEFAHRGLHDGAMRMENSASAAQAAIAAGMGIECDIQLSSDAVAIVFHDWELARLTGNSGSITQRLAAEICDLSLGSSGDSPMRLEQFLTLVKARVPLLIEIKSKPGLAPDACCRAVSNALDGYTGDCAVMSFDPLVSAWFAEHDPRRIRGLVCTDTLDDGWLSAWRKHGALDLAQSDFLACDIRDLPFAADDNLAAEWRARGQPLLSWTVRSAELRDRALAQADALISEGAGLAAQLLPQERAR